MPENIKPEAEVKAETEAKVEVKGKSIHETVGEGESEKNSIPEAAFLSEKKARKEAEREVKRLEKMISEGATKKEVTDEVSSIADEFNVDPKFLKKIAESIRKDVEADFEEKVSSKLKPIEEMNKAEKFDRAFKKDIGEVLADMPDFKDIVNQDVIKSLTLKYLSDSSKKNMTLREIVEETYGGALRGKRTIETTTPRGGKEPEDIDKARLKSDPSYFAEIMRTPSLKAKYNKEMMNRVQGFL